MSSAPFFSRKVLSLTNRRKIWINEDDQEVDENERWGTKEKDEQKTEITCK